MTDDSWQLAAGSFGTTRRSDDTATKLEVGSQRAEDKGQMMDHREKILSFY
jgi:hypothetical protein